MEVKGTAIASIPLFVDKTFGKPGLERWLQAMPEASRSIMGQSVRLSHWYPAQEALVDPTRALCDLFFEGDLRGARESGRFSAEFGLRGIYRAMVRLGSPVWVISRGSQLISLYYNPSELTVEDAAPGLIHVHITRFGLPHEIIDQRISGWVERAIEISGSKDVRVVVETSLARGDAETLLIVTYR